MRGGIVRSVMWWIYYCLFLGLCIFIFVTVMRYGIYMLFMEQRKLNGAQILYGVAVGVMIFGLLSMSIAYLTRSIWYRIKGQPGKRGQNLAPNRVLGDNPQEVPSPSSKP
jgi:hypothetical protein